MTLNEFKYWFDGYSESIKDAPTPEQWERLKNKLAEVVNATPPSYPPQYDNPNDDDINRFKYNAAFSQAYDHKEAERLYANNKIKYALL